MPTQTAVPGSTGIGAPGTSPAPANLARSPISTEPAGGSTAAIPFPRAATLATMRDKKFRVTQGSTAQITLQTNAFLENLVVDIVMKTKNATAVTVTFKPDAPWTLISQLKLTDPAGESIIGAITGYHWYLLNKYLIDTDCHFDPKQDPHYIARTGAGATAGTISMRLVVPIEHRKRNALGAVNNSAANQRYKLTINSISTFKNLYNATHAPKDIVTTTHFTVAITQSYWTTPPAVIKTKTGTVVTQKTPTGLGSVGFVRYETKTTVTGGGQPLWQLTNVGDYISQIIFILRDKTTKRDVYTPPQSTTNANWPPTFQWYVNDYQVHALTNYNYLGAVATGTGGVWPRKMARFFGYINAYETGGGLDNGVYTFTEMVGLLDHVENFGTSNQYLPTDATTKLQNRGSTWGAGSKKLEVLVRILRPISGAALYD